VEHKVLLYKQDHKVLEIMVDLVVADLEQMLVEELEVVHQQIQDLVVVVEDQMVVQVVMEHQE